MNLSQNSSATGLAAINALFNGATLTFYNGAIPYSPESALASTNTALTAFTFAATAFATPNYTSLQETAQAAFVAANATPRAAGTACFARAVANTGAVVLADYTIGMPWAPSTAVVAGQYMVNGGVTYVCTKGGTTAASGGPTGSSTNITDGTVVWTFANNGAPDIVLTEVVLSTAVPVTAPVMTHAMGAV